MIKKFSEEFKITDEEIKEIYLDLFDEEGDFSDEKKKIIKSFENCYINAVPGSGKTTTLVAKLMILAKKLEKKRFNRGICVLTHTNIGINIIKKKLGLKSNVLFNHPNFIGTLQSFIDKYLTIPYYKSEYKKTVSHIDNEYVNYRIKKIKDENYKIKSYLEKKHIKIEDIYYNFRDKNFKINEGSKGIVYKSNSNNSGNYLKFYDRIKNGFLKYEEAVQLADMYIEKYEILRNLFSNRFALVIVDEMQDTSDEMFNILEKLFDKNKTIVQYVGDRNQNIISGNNKWYNQEESKGLHISKSMRFGDNISKILNIIGDDIDVKGNENINSFKPVLICYDELKQYNVLNKFIDIIQDKKLDSKDEKIFKVVGRIGKTNEKGVTISNYFEKFVRNNDVANLTLEHIIKKDSKNNSENKIVIKEINNIIKKGLNSQEKFQEFENTLLDFTNKIEFKEIIFNFLKNENEVKLKENIINFIIKLDKFSEEEINGIKENFYKIEQNCEAGKINSYSQNNINLEISTAHFVKGETHTATLYLDTYFNKINDVDKLIQKIINKKKNIPKTYKNLLYVGSSRARYLLCFAINKNRIEEYNSNKIKLSEFFEIVEI